MSLSSTALDAFAEVARCGSFSRAARTLHVTQSALSQRIRNLEQELELKLLVRDRNGVRPTEAGLALMRLCERRMALEQEFFGEVRPRPSDGMAGLVRIVGFSTVMRSVVMPCLDPIVLINPAAQVHLIVRELADIPRLLREGTADLALTTAPIVSAGARSYLLGHEENVLVESRDRSRRERWYLDHDAEDATTWDFLEAQRSKRPTDVSRCYLDEIYTILDGVRRGWGRAVVPRHLIRAEDELRVVSGLRPLRIPVYLNELRQSYTPKLQSACVQALRDTARRWLQPAAK